MLVWLTSFEYSLTSSSLYFDMFAKSIDRLDRVPSRLLSFLFSRDSLTFTTLRLFLEFRLRFLTTILSSFVGINYEFFLYLNPLPTFLFSFSPPLGTLR